MQWRYKFVQWGGMCVYETSMQFNIVTKLLITIKSFRTPESPCKNKKKNKKLVPVSIISLEVIDTENNCEEQFSKIQF